MSYRNGTVLLAAHVDPVLRARARAAARAADLEFSQWVARALQQATEREALRRAIALAEKKLECGTCGHAPCACDQQ